MYHKYFDVDKMQEVTMECYSTNLYVKMQKVTQIPEQEKYKVPV